MRGSMNSEDPNNALFLLCSRDVRHDGQQEGAKPTMSLSFRVAEVPQPASPRYMNATKNTPSWPHEKKCTSSPDVVALTCPLRIHVRLPDAKG